MPKLDEKPLLQHSECSPACASVASRCLSYASIFCLSDSITDSVKRWSNTALFRHLGFHLLQQAL
eukprot:5392215-Prorocentrum_lima.AAC.1